MGIIEVPFVDNPNAHFCGQAVMAGVLSYTNNRWSGGLEDLRGLSSTTHEKWTSTTGIVLALDALGVRLEFCCDEQPADLDVFQNNTRISLLDNAVRMKLVRQKGILQTVAFKPDNLRHTLDDDKPVIALIDYRVFTRRRHNRPQPDNFGGHYVTVIGHEQDNFAINMPGPFFSKASMLVSSQLLFDAHQAPGTSRDTVVIHGLR